MNAYQLEKFQNWKNLKKKWNWT